MTSDDQKPQHDVFISYASEEREAVAQPLAEYLTALGLSVWFDQFSLKLGDSLRRRIDAGLADCRFGVVILSKQFFAKHWTNRELDGLAQREVEGTKIILPVWFDVDDVDVRRYSPPLADRVAARWVDGLPAVALKIFEVVSPERLRSYQQQIAESELHRIDSGAELANIVAGAELGNDHNDDPRNAAEAELVSDFLQEVHEWGEIWDELGPGERVRTEFRMGELLEALKQEGWSVYGARQRRRLKIAGLVDDWWCANLAVLRGEVIRVWRDKDKLVVVRPPKQGS